jgi:uncharacterized repeat protein (TIGR02543 family)
MSKRFLTAMLAMALVFGMAMVGCEHGASGAQNGAGDITNYTIVLGNVVNGSTYTATVMTGLTDSDRYGHEYIRIIGVGEAKAENDFAIIRLSIRLSPYNGGTSFNPYTGEETPFNEGIYTVRVTSGTIVKEKTSIAFTTGGNIHIDWSTMGDDEENIKDLLGTSTAGEKFVVLTGVGEGFTYSVETFVQTDGFESEALTADKWATATASSRRIGMGAAKAASMDIMDESATVEVSMTDLATGKAFTRTGVFIVAVKEKDASMHVVQTRYMASVMFAEGSTTLGWEVMEAVPTAVESEEEAEEAETPDAAHFTVSFETGEGSRVAPVSVTEGKALKVPAEPVLAGFRFDGWFMDKAMERAFDFSMPVTADITLYAKWAKIDVGTMVVLSFDAMGGEMTESHLVVAYGEKAEEPAHPVKEYHSFAGWFMDTAMTMPFSFEMPVMADMMLYAKWTMKGFHDLQFVYTIGGEMTTHDLQTVKEGATAKMPEAPAEEGFAFVGWFSDAAMTVPFDFSMEVVSSMTVYGKMLGFHDVHFVYFVDGEMITHVTQSVKEGEMAVMPEEAPVYEHFAFGGWFMDMEMTVPFADMLVMETMTVYGMMTDIRHTVTFMDEGMEVSHQMVDDMALAMHPATPVKEGHVFGGWFMDEMMEMPFDFKTPVTADMMIHAKWFEMPFASVEMAVSYMNGETVESGTADDPVKLAMSMSLAGNAWSTFMDMMDATGKHFALDLSASSVAGMTGVSGEFDAAKKTGKMMSVVLPADATSIKASSFEGSSMKMASGAGVVTIGDMAFYKSGLAMADFPMAEHIGKEAFMYCSSLSSVSFPMVKTMGDMAFAKAGMAMVDFPELREAGKMAFGWMPGLADVRMPKIERMGMYMFMSTGGNDMTIMLGANAPHVGSMMFVPELGMMPKKSITVRIPADEAVNMNIGMSGYSAAWMDTFKFHGTDGTSMPDMSNCMANITAKFGTY